MMPVKSLRCFFYPRSVAVVGASSRPGSVGRQVFENLLSSGFEGQLYPVNLRHPTVLDRTAFASVRDIDDDLELAVIATPADTVLEVLGACADKGVKGALILSAGFAEAGAAGQRRQRQLLDLARRRGIRILGPNCLGVICTGSKLNATFSRGNALPGDLALVSQSGALCTAILDWAKPRAIGFSAVVSLGDAADVDFGELLDALALDPATKSILLYIEGIHDARRFVSGLRAAARLKPVVVLKSGRHGPGIQAAISHTGALASADDAFEAALERAGAVRVYSIGQLFALAQMLGAGARARGNRLAVVSNAGGPGVMAADRAFELRVELVDFEEPTLARLNAALPSQWSHGNPIDVLGDADASRYEHAVTAALADRNVDAVLTILTPQAMSEPLNAARAVAQVAKTPGAVHRKLVMACWMGGEQVAEARALFERERIVQFNTPEAAVEAFHYLAQYEESQKLLLQVPGPLSVQGVADIRGAQLIIEGALAEQRTLLTGPESKALLRAFCVPTNQAILARDANEALVAAESLGLPVALKIESSQIPHKSDVGGVVLNVASAHQVKCEYHALLERVAERRPKAEVRGVLVERMCSKPHGRELIVGAFRDPVFGPVLSFGLGGVAVELLRDRSVALPPLNPLLARRLVERTRSAPFLQAFRQYPPVDLLALERVLLSVSEMVCELPHIVEIEINPLIVDESGAMAVDCRVHVERPKPGLGNYRHMAIHPYPSDMVSSFQLPDGTDVTLRPVRPEDAAMEAEFVRNLSPEARYMRFMTALSELPQDRLARFTQIDYDREMALVATVQRAGVEQEVGAARYYTNPDGESCEFALVVADAWQKRGIGSQLMDRLMRVAAARGLRYMSGEVLASNASMLALMRGLGFSVSGSTDPEVVEVTRELA